MENGKSDERDERAIRDLMAVWMAATEAGDERVLNLMADDAMFLRADQPPMRGKAAFAESQTSQTALSQVRIEAAAEVQKIRVFGDWAYCWNRLTVTAAPESGKPLRRRSDVLSIFQKRADRWVLFRDANLLAKVAQ